VTGAERTQVSHEQLGLNYRLRWAAEKGDLSKLQPLIAQGADINSRDSRNRTALLLAVQNRHADIVKALLENGADPSLADLKGNTPLKAALRSGQTEIVETLRQHGAE